jgi:hypothetical protein
MTVMRTKWASLLRVYHETVRETGDITKDLSSSSCVIFGLMTNENGRIDPKTYVESWYLRIHEDLPRCGWGTKDA